MIHSRDRILASHVGSLPRNETLSDLLVAQERAKASIRNCWPAKWTRRSVTSSKSRWKPASIRQ